MPKIENQKNKEFVRFASCITIVNIQLNKYNTKFLYDELICFSLYSTLSVYL